MIDSISSPEAFFYFRHYETDFCKKFPNLKIEKIHDLGKAKLEIIGEVDKKEYFKFLEEKNLAEDSFLFGKRETQLL